MIAKRQFSPDTTTSSDKAGPLSTASGSVDTVGDGGPARQLQSRLADAITALPQTGTWHVDLGHISSFDAAMIPQHAKSIALGISGGSFITVCLFMMLD